MYSIKSLSKHDVRFLRQLLNSAYYNSEFRNNHKSDLSDEERSILKEHFDFVSDLRLKLVFNVYDDDDAVKSICIKCLKRNYCESIKWSPDCYHLDCQDFVLDNSKKDV